MTFGIAKTPNGWVQEFQRACESLDLQHRLIDIHCANWIEQIRGIDAFLWRPSLEDSSGIWEMHSKLPLVEEMGIACYPSTKMLWFYDNKIRESQFLKLNDYPTPFTFISFDQTDALNFAAGATYPLVVKTSGGASSLGVDLVSSERAARRIINATFCKTSVAQKLKQRWLRQRGDYLSAMQLSAGEKRECYVYFQEFIETDYDWRVTTFGSGICSVFKRLNRPNDFRASGSGRWEKVSESTLPQEACNLALEISESQGFTSMTYDFMESHRGLLISEFSFTFLLNQIYSDTLFQRFGETFRQIGPIPVGVLHLKALICEMEKKGGFKPRDTRLEPRTPFIP